MKTFLRPLLITLGGFLLCSGQLFATSATIEGIVSDQNYKPMSGAQIRVEGREGSGLNTLTRTDDRGHYSVSGLSDGTFRVSLIIGGQVKACIANVLATMGQSQTLNFSLAKAGGAIAGPHVDARPLAAGRHYVWVPMPTGSHLAGYWVEVDDHQTAISAGMRERLNNRANNYVKQIQSNAGTMRQ